MGGSGDLPSWGRTGLVRRGAMGDRAERARSALPLHRETPWASPWGPNQLPAGRPRSGLIVEDEGVQTRVERKVDGFEQLATRLASAPTTARQIVSLTVAAAASAAVSNNKLSRQHQTQKKRELLN